MGLRAAQLRVLLPFPRPTPCCLLPRGRPAQLALPLRQSFNRLCVVQRSFHSLAHACSPRRMNRSQPRPSLICPNTGSTVWPRVLYKRRPRFVSSARSIRSRAVRRLGIRPRGAGCSRWAFRCFQSLFVATSSSGPSGPAVVKLASLQYPASANAVPMAWG